MKTPILTTLLAAGMISAASAAVVFTESFESSTAPDAGGGDVTGSSMTFTNWVTANTGYGGAFNSIAVATEAVNYKALGQAVNADGTQFYIPGTYSGDSGLTTKQDAIAAIAAGTDYTFTFAAAKLSLAGTGKYDFQIWALNGLADTGRRDSRSGESTLSASGQLLHSVSGSVTSNDFTNVSNIFTYTLNSADAAAYVGWDLAIRLDGTGDGGAIDNVQVTAIPEPAAALLGGLGFLMLLRRRRA